MLKSNRAPAVAAGTRNGDQLGSEIVPTIIQPARVSQADLSSALSVSDGGITRGFIVETKGASIAVDTDGGIIGAFSTRREAFKAISEQHRRP
jgi:hypothetical protein